MWPLALVPLLAAQGPAETFSARPESAAIAVVLAPGQSEARGDTSGVLSTFSLVLKAQSTVRVASPEQVGLDVARLLACPPEQRLSCWAREALVVAPSADYLFVLSVTRRERDAPLLTTLMVDLSAARAAHVGADAAEAAIYGRAVRTEPVAIDPADPGSLSQALGAGPIRAALAAAGRWGASGRLRVSGAPAGSALRLDGLELGTVGGGEAVIERVPAGARRVELVADGGVVWSQSIELPAGAELALAPPALRPAASGEAWLWSGGGATSAGVVAGAIGLAMIAGRAPHACVVRSIELEAGCAPPSRDGAALVGLGAGLAVAGAGWLAVGSVDSAREWPAWLPVAGGLVLGAAAGVAVGLASP